MGMLSEHKNQGINGGPVKPTGLERLHSSKEGHQLQKDQDSPDKTDQRP